MGILFREYVDNVQPKMNMERQTFKHAKPLAMSETEYVYYWKQAKTGLENNTSAHIFQVASDSRLSHAKENHSYRNL